VLRLILIKFGIKSLPTGIPVPVRGSIQFDLKSNTSSGAILITESPIIKTVLYGPDSVWSNWVSNNSEQLLKVYKTELHDYGLWIVNQTYATKEAYITVLQKEDRSREIGFTAEVTGVGKVDPHGGWSEQGSHGEWAKYPTQIGTTKASLGEDERMVVFVSGFYFKLGLFHRSVRHSFLPSFLPFRSTDSGEWEWELIYADCGKTIAEIFGPCFQR